LGHSSALRSLVLAAAGVTAAPATGPAAAFAQAPATGSFNLSEIAVEGAQRLTVPDITRESGLTIGQPVTVDAIGAAANRLVATGLFKTVRFRYVTQNGQMSVTFTVEEAQGGLPVTFDNFVWFTDDDLAAAVRATVPSFDGTAPPTAGVIETIRGALTALLSARGLPGKVAYSPDTEMTPKGGRQVGHVFRVESPGPRLCGVRFEGAAAVPSRDLLAAIQDLVSADYSKVRLAARLRGTLTDVYRERGFWRAEFRRPLVALDSACGGVNAVITVSEGPAFVFDRTEWNGNNVMPAARLDSLLGIRPGDRANFRQLDDGVRKIARAYGHEGYIVAASTYEPRLDEATKRATFVVTVTEGPQFHFGTVDFAGFSDRDVQDLRKKWRLKTGDVFDADYPLDFSRDHLMPSGGGTMPAVENRVDAPGRVVNIRFVRR